MTTTPSATPAPLAMPSDVTPQKHDPSNGADPRWVRALDASDSEYWQFHSWLQLPSNSVSEGNRAVVNGVECVAVKDTGCKHCPASSQAHFKCYVTQRCIYVQQMNLFWVSTEKLALLRLKGEL